MSGSFIAQKPLFLAINEKSGGNGDLLADDIVQKLQAAGHTVSLYLIPSGKRISESCEAFVRQVAGANGILVAAGGDGTVNAMASLCYRHKVTFGVIPLGTFNYFARALNIPTDIDEAIGLLGAGKPRQVSAGFVNENLFINNASFGLYPKLIRRREAATSRFGRRRIVAALSALGSLLSRPRRFSMKLKINGVAEQHYTNMVFVGNNTLQLEYFGLEVGECTKINKLAVIILKPANRFRTAWLIFRGTIRNLVGEPSLEQFCADDFEVETKHKSLEIVLDGEIVRCTVPLQFRVDPQAISVIMPNEGEGQS